MFDPSIKAVLWDLDDTLYSRVNAARKTFPGMFRQHLYENRSDAFIDETVDYMMTKIHRNSMIHEDAFRALLEKYPSDKPYNRADCLNYYYAHICDFAQPNADCMEVVKKLRARGIKTAIVTNISADRLDSQHRKVESMNLAPYFDAIVYSGELGIHKPDRRIFDHAAQLLGVPNHQCLFVGDDPTSDVAGALNAGMEAVWIDRWQTENCFQGDTRVHRVTNISDYFQL